MHCTGAEWVGSFHDFDVHYLYNYQVSKVTGDRGSTGYRLTRYLSADPYSREDQTNFAKWYVNYGIFVTRCLIFIR